MNVDGIAINERAELCPCSRRSLYQLIWPNQPVTCPAERGSHASVWDRLDVRTAYRERRSSLSPPY